MAKQPMAEVFGFPIDNMSPAAKRGRVGKLCPFHNVVPECTKDRVAHPLGVCSVLEGDRAAITCPIRFRQNWKILDDAASFFFSRSTRWDYILEVRLPDREGKSAGNIDVVLVALDDQNRVIDFGAVEVQAVYISGNIRNPFEHYIADPEHRATMDWTGQPHFPRPDYLSSSRKRLAPQLIYKGGILKSWGKKIAVVLNTGFFATLPSLPEVAQEQANLAWFVYDLERSPSTNTYNLALHQAYYTTFLPALERLTQSDAGDVQGFVDGLQRKLLQRRQAGHVPLTTAKC